MKRLLSITLLFSLQLYPHTDQEQQQQYEQFSQDVRSWNPVTMARLALCRPDQQQHDQLRSLAWDSKDKSVLDHLEKTGYKTTDAAEFIKVPFNIVMRHKLLTVALLVASDLSRDRGAQSRLLGAWRRVQTKRIFNNFWDAFAGPTLIARYDHGHTIGQHEGFAQGSKKNNGICSFTIHEPLKIVSQCSTLCEGAGVISREPHHHDIFLGRDGSIKTTQVKPDAT